MHTCALPESSETPFARERVSKHLKHESLEVDSSAAFKEWSVMPEEGSRWLSVNDLGT